MSYTYTSMSDPLNLPAESFRDRMRSLCPHTTRKPVEVDPVGTGRRIMVEECVVCGDQRLVEPREMIPQTRGFDPMDWWPPEPAQAGLSAPPTGYIDPEDTRDKPMVPDRLKVMRERLKEGIRRTPPLTPSLYTPPEAPVPGQRIVIVD